MNACRHHHVGNIGLLGVSKNGADWYQIILGGSADNQTTLGKVLGPVIGKQEIGHAVEVIIETYLELREQGDIRAQGEVLRDQLSFMQRCGVSQFHLADCEDTDLALSAFTDISGNYQPELIRGSLKVYAG